MDRLDHNKTKHIHDNWPDSGSKRDLSMIKTSSISEPKKKKTAYELEMKERSDNMDSKILEKRKKDEMEDILNKKLIEEKKKQQEIKESLDKKKKNTKKISKGSLHKKTEFHLPKNVKELPDLV